MRGFKYTRLYYYQTYYIILYKSVLASIRSYNIDMLNSKSTAEVFILKYLKQAVYTFIIKNG